MNVIHYKAGFKYQLTELYVVQIDVWPTRNIKTAFIQLNTDGLLSIAANYAWDGPSGPAIDSDNFLRASLVHDALYQLMRMGALHQSQRGDVDDEMLKICLEDGMWRLRAWWVWRAVRTMAAGAADARALKPVLSAP